MVNLLLFRCWFTSPLSVKIQKNTTICHKNLLTFPNFGVKSKLFFCCFFFVFAATKTTGFGKDTKRFPHVCLRNAFRSRVGTRSRVNCYRIFWLTALVQVPEELLPYQRFPIRRSHDLFSRAGHSTPKNKLEKINHNTFVKRTFSSKLCRFFFKYYQSMLSLCTWNTWIIIPLAELSRLWHMGTLEVFSSLVFDQNFFVVEMAVAVIAEYNGSLLFLSSSHD